MTKNSATLPGPGNAYIEIAHKIAKSYRKHVHTMNGGDPYMPIPDGPIDWVRLSVWLRDSKRLEVAPSTWITYKNAIKHATQAHPDHAAVCAILDIQPHNRRRDVHRRGAGKRQKSLSREDIAAIADWIGQRNLRWGTPALIWLRAGMTTGLRPNEWDGARITRLPDGQAGLVVHNAKTGNQNDLHVNAERIIPLGHLEEEEYLEIVAHTDLYQRIRALGDEHFERYARGCRQTLYRAAKELWPRRKKIPNLYSGRHQFAANLKANDILLPEERAYMLGHSSIHTHQNCYGGRRSAHPNARTPIPLREHVDAVFSQLMAQGHQD